MTWRRDDTLICLFAGAAAGFAAYVAEQFAVTSRGVNPWSFTAFYNALRISPYVFKAIDILSGELDSAYRSPSINGDTPGASSGSYHLLGLAADIKPGSPWKDTESAFRAVAAQVKLGGLGPVRTVIWEPGWVHLDWFQAKEPLRDVNFFKREGTDAAPTYTKVDV